MVDWRTLIFAASLGAELDHASVPEYRETMLGLWRRVLAKG